MWRNTLGDTLDDWLMEQLRGGLTLYDCARLGVHLHGLAANRWAETHGNAGMLASDLLPLIPEALRACR